MTHANAPFAELGRLKLAQLVVDDGWPVERVADRIQCASGTVRRWAARYRTGGRWRTAPRGRSRRRIGHRRGWSGGSSRCASIAAGDRTGSATTWASHDRRSVDQATGLPVRRRQRRRGDATEVLDIHVDPFTRPRPIATDRGLFRGADHLAGDRVQLCHRWRSSSGEYPRDRPRLHVHAFGNPVSP